MATEEKRMQQLKNDTAGWAANDITPLNAEWCVETNGADARAKIGDGALAYSNLNFVTRRTDAEFDSAATTLIDGMATDVSVGVGDAGKLVKLDSAGVIDSSMVSSGSGDGSFNILGSIDFTATPPTPGGGFSAGDVYFNTTAGQFHGAWLFGQDGSGNERPCEVGDMVVYDEIAAGWQFVQGKRSFALIDRDYADDTAAATGGVPIGSLYHTSGAVKVRLT